MSHSDDIDETDEHVEPSARTALVTGASSGIGAATARALALDGLRVVCAARRTDRVEDLAREIGGIAATCDVTDAASVAALARRVEDELGGRLDVLVNNAGGAFGADSVTEASVEDWARMYDVNVLGLVRVTQAMLPAMRRSDGPLVVNVGSTAGRVAYENGGGYTAAKHGTKVLSATLRLELSGEPFRITEIAPGMVATDEFALVRFEGDESKAAAVYDDVDHPLTADDVAETIRWVAGLPRHVNIDELVVRPVAQAAQHKVFRGPLFR